MDAKIKDLDVKIGELTVERDFLSRGLARQCKILLISRSFRLFSAEGRERRDAGVDAPH